MSPVIRVTDEVYTALQKRAEPFVDTPNDVLRRLLDLAPQGATAEEGREGELARLIASGELAPGDRVKWLRSRHRTTHVATVTSGGCLQVEGSDAPPYRSPSGAAQAICGHQVNGWRTWRRASDGRLLDELRS